MKHPGLQGCCRALRCTLDGYREKERMVVRLGKRGTLEGKRHWLVDAAIEVLLFISICFL